MKTEVEEISGKRLWIVSELYYPEDTSTGFHMTQIAEGLAGHFHVNVLCGQPTYAHRGTRAAKKETHNGVSITRASGSTLNKDVAVFRLLNMATLGLSILFHGLKNFRRGDKVMVVTTPPTMPFIVALASIIKRAKYVVLVFDNHPETLVAAGKLKADSLAVKLLNRANRWLYKRSWKVITIGRDMKALVEEKAAFRKDAKTQSSSKVEMIPLWADADTITPEPRDDNAIFKELGIEDKFVVLYAGNMGSTHDVESIYECAEQLREDESIHFLFAGGGAKRKWLEREHSEKKLPNVTLLDRQPRERLNTLLNACDVAVITVVKNMIGVSVPSRITNIMASGKPVLAMTDPLSEIALMIDEEDIGKHIEPQNVDQLFSAILEFHTRKNDLVGMGSRARLAAEKHFILADRIREYVRVLGD